MRIEDDIKLDFNDVLIRPKRSTLVSRKNAELNRVFSFKYSKHIWKGVPIVASNMDHVGTSNMAEVLSSYNMLTALCKFVEFPKNNDLQYLMRTIGLDVELDFETPTWLCIDIANGYTERFFNYINKVREKHSNAIIVAGNVCTPEATEQIILAGADIVKLGIGPGSVCTTRKMTGVGYPQLSCIIECADAAHGLGGHMIADGGCTCPGDIAKAFGGGADFVMLGGMLAGHSEGGGEIISVDGKNFIEFYGSSSEEANDKHYGGLDEYRSAEGKKVRIPYRGALEETIKDILGGVRSTCTYVGAPSLKQLSKCTTFVRVNNQYNDIFGRV